MDIAKPVGQQFSHGNYLCGVFSQCPSFLAPGEVLDVIERADRNLVFNASL
jgi:hypothetical protein